MMQKLRDRQICMYIDLLRAPVVMHTNDYLSGPI